VQQADQPREGAQLVSVEAVASVDIADLEVRLAQALNARMPVEDLDAVLRRLHRQLAVKYGGKSR